MSGNGYVPKRRGVLEHLQDGRLTLQELGAHDVLLLLANKSTGIWKGSAKALAANCGAGDISERQARHILEGLESRGYIKRFSVRRSHRNYPILIDKFQVTFGAYTGMRLNAAATTDWRNPVYEPCLEPGVEQGVLHGAKRAPIRKGDLRKRPEKEPFAPAQEPSQEAIALASLLKHRIVANVPTAKITEAQEIKWAREADLMMGRDERSVPQIRELIEWSQKDLFWGTNILSMGKLREKFDQLTAKKNADAKGALSRAEQRDLENLRVAGFTLRTS